MAESLGCSPSLGSSMSGRSKRLDTVFRTKLKFAGLSWILDGQILVTGVS